MLSLLKANGSIIEGMDGKVSMPLPTLTECNQIPDNRKEIPTPEAAAHHPHLKSVASLIPPLDPSAEILLLLGRDIIRAHKVRSQVNGPHDTPYAQCLDLGWVIIGDVCLIGAHKPTVNSFKTSIFENGRPSFLIPCENRIHLMERFTNTCSPFEKTQTKDDVGKLIFKQTVDDDNSR